MRKMFLLAALAAAPVFASGAQVAILDSANTKAFFALHYPDCSNSSFFLGADEYRRYFLGWTYVLGQAGIPYDIINDGNVTDDGLSGYKVLILSNTVSLTDDQEHAVQKWVIHGGRLMATFGSGYKDIISDPRQIDGLKLQSGGTFGLHQLWHDPMSKVFGSNAVNNGQGSDVRITQYDGPSASLAGQLTGDLLPYGAESNLLIQRPEQFSRALGFVVLKNYTLDHPTPAILVNRAAQGLVAYFAFAPEYLVSLEFNLAGKCPADSQIWTGRSAEGRILMLGAINYLLNN